MKLETPVRISEADPVKVHVELAKQHGPYSRFEEMMEQYNAQITRLNVTGAIGVITTFEGDMRQNNQVQYLPIIAALNRRLTDWSLAIAGCGGGVR